MKTPILGSTVLLVSALLALTFSACSKENPEAKKVDVSAMIQALKSDAKDTRVHACIELGKAGPRAEPAVQALIGALKDPDPLVRRLSAYALGTIGPKASAALPALKELLADPDREVPSSAVNAMRSIDPKSIDVKVPNIQTPP